MAFTLRDRGNFVGFFAKDFSHLGGMMEFLELLLPRLPIHLFCWS